MSSVACFVIRRRATLVEHSLECLGRAEFAVNQEPEQLDPTGLAQLAFEHPNPPPSQPKISLPRSVPAEQRRTRDQLRESKMANRLYVGNLSFSSSDQTLRDAFSAHGEVLDVHVVSDRVTGQSRGFGFVTMGSHEQAQSAISAMSGADLDGRALRVNEAEERSGGGRSGGGGRGGRW